MNLDLALAEAQKDIPDCIATALIDRRTGTLLGEHSTEGSPHNVLEFVATATGELFQEHNVSALSSMFQELEEGVEDNDDFFQEILLVSDELLHVFLRQKTEETLVLLLICRISANLGMVLTRGRSHLQQLAQRRTSADEP